MSHTARIEHANIMVSDAKATACKLCEVFGWTIRWSGSSIHDGHSVHVGGADNYLALYTPKSFGQNRGANYEEVNGLNHIGVVVDDLDAAERRVIAAGFTPQSHADYEPGRRFYFYDRDNIEFEVISYAPNPESFRKAFLKMLGVISKNAALLR